MKFDETRKIGKWKIRGYEYYVYEIVLPGNKRKRIYGKTLAELRERVEEYVVPTMSEDMSFGACIRHFIENGEVNKKEAADYALLLEDIPERIRKINAPNVTKEDIDTFLEQIEDADKAKVMRHFMARLVSFCSQKGIMKLDPADFTEPLSAADYLAIKNTAYDRATYFGNPRDDLWGYQRECCMYFTCILGLTPREMQSITAEHVIFENGRAYIDIPGRNERSSIPNIAAPFLKNLIKHVPEGCIFGNCNRVNMGLVYKQYGSLLHIEGITSVSIRSAYIIFLLQHNVPITKVASLLSVAKSYILRAYGSYCDLDFLNNDKIADFIGGAI